MSPPPSPTASVAPPVSPAESDPLPAWNLARWFEDEVHPHEPVLKGWLRRHFPFLPDVEDLVQETYLRLCKARRQGRVTHARSYLYATAQNAAIDLVRRSARNPIDQSATLDVSAILAEGPLFPDVPGAPHLDLLAEAVQSLPERRRQVLILRKLQNRSHAEIAQLLGISENTVSAHLTYAMRQCRAYLEARGLKGGDL